MTAIFRPGARQSRLMVTWQFRFRSYRSSVSFHLIVEMEPFKLQRYITMTLPDIDWILHIMSLKHGADLDLNTFGLSVKSH